jgi:ketosteroid isomerase-like protein
MRSWAVVMAGATYVQFFLTDLQASIDGDMAVVTCGESMLTAAEEGAADSFVGARAVSTKVLKRTPGGWRVTLHHSSPVLSPSGGSGDADDAGTDEGAA